MRRDQSEFVLVCSGAEQSERGRGAGPSSIQGDLPEAVQNQLHREVVLGVHRGDHQVPVPLPERVQYPAGQDHLLFGHQLQVEEHAGQVGDVGCLAFAAQELGQFFVETNRGRPIEVIQQAGRWQSVEAPRYYIRADETSRGVSALLATLYVSLLRGLNF